MILNLAGYNFSMINKQAHLKNRRIVFVEAAVYLPFPVTTGGKN